MPNVSGPFIDWGGCCSRVRRHSNCWNECIGWKELFPLRFSALGSRVSLTFVFLWLLEFVECCVEVSTNYQTLLFWFHINSVAVICLRWVFATLLIDAINQSICLILQFQLSTRYDTEHQIAFEWLRLLKYFLQFYNIVFHVDRHFFVSENWTDVSWCWSGAARAPQISICHGRNSTASRSWP